jgi:hypothetical protein
MHRDWWLTPIVLGLTAESGNDNLMATERQALSERLHVVLHTSPGRGVKVGDKQDRHRSLLDSDDGLVDVIALQ